MKLIYHKSCFYNTIYCELDSNSFILNANPSEGEELKIWNDNLNNIKNVFFKIIECLSLDELKYQYIYNISHDYDNPCYLSEAVLKNELNKYLQNYSISESYEIYNLFEILQSMIEFLPNKNNQERHDCETCGDYNYSHEVEI